MATTNASPYSGYFSTPQVLPNGNQGYGAKTIVFRALVTYASQAAADVIRLFKLPKGITPLFGILNADTSSGTTTIAIGNSTTAAKYKAAAAFTTTDTPTLFGKAAAVGGVTPSTTEEEVIATLAAATAPASGLLTIDMVCATL